MSPPTRLAPVVRQAVRDPRSLPPRDVLQLQRAVGNREVGRLLAGAVRGRTPPGTGDATCLP
ncbi:MAG TPA: hypothetical protein VF570_02715, partial [Pyrinomonadaceae bacterium]